MLGRACPSIPLTWATSRRTSMIRWLAKVWRRSWKSDPPPTLVEARAEGRAPEHPLGDVVVQERRPPAGREHVVGAGAETRALLVAPQDRAKLREQRELAHRGAGLR